MGWVAVAHTILPVAPEGEDKGEGEGEGDGLEMRAGDGKRREKSR